MKTWQLSTYSTYSIYLYINLSIYLEHYESLGSGFDQSKKLFSGCMAYFTCKHDASYDCFFKKNLGSSAS